MLSEKNVIQKSDNSIESTIDGDIVLMNLDNNEYYSMDDIGSAIWQMLNEPKSIERIINELLKQYKVDREVCAKDTMKFLEQLYDKGIIKINE
ncbi:MAG: lasso peptide biosynthesis PqqD family chaperone [Bacteroidales bacterium]|nr:lasso peptide biosynthesis PqqD family chaperone [Bacteroidales bacterium]